jgi:hypothetical protein
VRRHRAPGRYLDQHRAYSVISLAASPKPSSGPLVAAIFAGRLASPVGSLLDVALDAGTAPAPPHPPRAPDLLDGLAARFNRGYAVGAPILRRALQAFRSGMPPDPGLRWLSLACGTAFNIWDDEGWAMLSDRYVQLAREAGTLSELPWPSCNGYTRYCSLAS